MQLECYGLLRKNYALFLVIFVNFDQLLAFSSEIVEIWINISVSKQESWQYLKSIRIRIRSPDDKLKKEVKSTAQLFVQIQTRCWVRIQYWNEEPMPFAFICQIARSSVSDDRWLSMVLWREPKQFYTLRLDFYNFGIWKGKKNETRNLFASFWREWCDHCITE